VLSYVNHLLLDFATFTVGAHSLEVGAVPLAFSLYVDRSYVDGGICVVFIIDTTTQAPSGVACQAINSGAAIPP
jgi:hypothetical protein